MVQWWILSSYLCLHTLLEIICVTLMTRNVFLNVSRLFFSFLKQPLRLSPPHPRLLSANVSSVKPDHRDNHHSSAISTKSLAGSECEEMLCCQVGGSGFSPDEWRKGSATPVNDPQRPPGFLSRDHSMAYHYVSLKNQNGLCSRFPPRGLYRDSCSAETQEFS